jgi:hypothetical protein
MPKKKNLIDWRAKFRNYVPAQQAFANMVKDHKTKPMFDAARDFIEVFNCPLNVFQLTWNFPNHDRT